MSSQSWRKLMHLRLFSAPSRMKKLTALFLSVWSGDKATIIISLIAKIQMADFAHLRICDSVATSSRPSVRLLVQTDACYLYPLFPVVAGMTRLAPSMRRWSPLSRKKVLLCQYTGVRFLGLRFLHKINTFACSDFATNSRGAFSIACRSGAHQVS